MSVVAITGVSGYIGRGVAAQFEADEQVEKIIGIDIRPPVNPPSKLEFHQRSVADPFDDIFRAAKPDTALHLAFVLNPIHDVRLMERINVGGTENFLRACEAGDTQVIGVTSSATAYGAQPDNPSVIFEGSPLRADPSFPYAYHKVLQEQVCYRWIKEHSDRSLIIVRPSVIIGPNVSNFISRYIERNVLMAIKGYNPPLQFTHEDDVVLVIHRLLKLKRSGIFNIGGDGSVRLSEAAHLMKKRFMFVPHFIVKILITLGWWLRLSSVTEAPAGMLPFIMHPWVVQNSKVKHEILYSFRYSSKGALIDYLDSKAGDV